MESHPAPGSTTTAEHLVRSGIEIRPFRSPDDYEVLAAVFEACMPVDGFEQPRSAEFYQQNYAAYGMHPEEIGFVAEADGHGIAYVVGCDDGDSEDLGQRRFHVGLVRPDWRRRGVGAELLRRIQGRLLDVLPTGGGRASFITDVLGTQEGTRELFEGHGYHAARYSFGMVRPNLDDLPSVELPAGISSHPAREDEVSRIFWAMDEAMREEPGWTPFDDDKVEAAAAHPLFGQRDIWQVAWDGDVPVGGVLGWIDDVENEQQHRRRGYTEGIWVRRPWRGCGIASALIARNMHELRRRGMTEAALSVDADNPTGALHLYERHGFRRVRTGVRYARPIGGRPTR
jgi:mycothiol synthase